jgi:hypothetical protein
LSAIIGFSANISAGWGCNSFSGYTEYKHKSITVYAITTPFKRFDCILIFLTLSTHAFIIDNRDDGAKKYVSSQLFEKYKHVTQPASLFVSSVVGLYINNLIHLKLLKRMASDGYWQLFKFIGCRKRHLPSVDAQRNGVFAWLHAKILRRPLQKARCALHRHVQTTHIISQNPA